MPNALEICAQRVSSCQGCFISGHGVQKESVSAYFTVPMKLAQEITPRMKAITAPAGIASSRYFCGRRHGCAKTRETAVVGNPQDFYWWRRPLGFRKCNRRVGRG